MRHYIILLINLSLQDREEVFFLVSLFRDGGSNPPPAINLVGITLSVYRRSMIRLNLSHEKMLLLILLSGVRTEKHNGMYLSWESGGRIVLDVGGSSPPFPITLPVV